MVTANGHEDGYQTGGGYQFADTKHHSGGGGNEKW
jgi:hypothetical protein